MRPFKCLAGDVFKRDRYWDAQLPGLKQKIYSKRAGTHYTVIRTAALFLSGFIWSIIKFVGRWCRVTVVTGKGYAFVETI